MAACAPGDVERGGGDADAVRGESVLPRAGPPGATHSNQRLSLDDLVSVEAGHGRYRDGGEQELCLGIEGGEC
jgi:hypothetical protein